MGGCISETGQGHDTGPSIHYVCKLSTMPLLHLGHSFPIKPYTVLEILYSLKLVGKECIHILPKSIIDGWLPSPVCMQTYFKILQVLHKTDIHFILTNNHTQLAYNLPEWICVNYKNIHLVLYCFAVTSTNFLTHITHISNLKYKMLQSNKSIVLHSRSRPQTGTV